MGTPHKWSDVIHAIADGKDVQLYYALEWIDYDSSKHNSPIENPESKWRIKPEPKPDVVKVIHFDNDTISSEDIFVSNNSHNSHAHWESHVKLTFDGETGKLKSAEVL